MDLKGKRILVVEDDFYLADELCRDLRQHGAVVLGPAPTPFYALQLLGRRGVDGAILDVKLHGVPVFELADELARRGTPLMFSSILGEEKLPERYKNKTLVRKPYDRICVINAIAEMASKDVIEVPQDSAVEYERFPDDRERISDRHERMMMAICGILKRSVQGNRPEEMRPRSDSIADHKALVAEQL